MIRRTINPWNCVAVCLAVSFAAAPAYADSALRVRGIRASESSGVTAVVIQSSARPTFTTWKLEQPARVVVEISGARLGDVAVPMDVGTRAVGMVTASVTEDPLGGPRTRIVLTLRQPSDYRVLAKGSEIQLRVVPHGTSKDSQGIAAEPSARTVPPAPALIPEQKARDTAEVRAAQQAKAEADRLAALAGDAKKAAELQSQVAARAKAAAEAETHQAVLAKNEALAQAQSEATARKAAQLKSEEQRLQMIVAQKAVAKEMESRRLLQAQAEELARQEARAKAEVEHLRKALAHAQSEAASAQAMAARATEEKQREMVARSQAEAARREQSQAKMETERLRKALLEAQAESERARAMASAAREENKQQQVNLAQAEAALVVAKQAAEGAERRAAQAEAEMRSLRLKESEQGRALQVATQEVEHRKQLLDRMLKEHEDQRSKLATVASRVAARESALSAHATELAAREAAANVARAKRDALAKDTSEKARRQASVVVAKAEAQQRHAEQALLLSRRELEKAVADRKAEEDRRTEQLSLRKEEERRLADAIRQRKDEEVRLAKTQAERQRLESEHTRMLAARAEQERARVARVAAEAHRTSLATASKPVPAPVAAAPAAPAPAASVPKATPPVAAAPMAATPAQVPVAAPLPSPRTRSITLRARSQIRNIEFIDEPNRSSVIIDVDASAEISVERMRDRKISLRIDHADLPLELERNLDATEYLGPVKIVSSYRDPLAKGTVRVVVDLAEDVPHRIRKDGARIFWDFQKAQVAPSPSLPAIWTPPVSRLIPAQKWAGVFMHVTESAWLSQALPSPPTAGQAGPAGGARPSLVGKKRYVGRRIDLDFKGADIHNILRLLADVGGVNIVVADEVKGDVTIKMRDVPWDQALDVVLRAKGLGSIREGNLLRVAPLAMLEKELEAEIARQKQIADVLPTETRLIGVSYAEAGSMVDKARDLLTPRGKISVDTRTNNIIVSDVAKNLQLVEDLVRNLDTQTSQVVIEARIVEANSNFARQMGIQWGGSGFADSTHGNPTGLVFPYNIGIGGGADDGSSPLGGLVPGPRTGTGTTGSPNFLVNMPAPAGLGTGSAIGLTMGSVAGAFNLNLRLSAMESQGQVRILSSPRITTMDNVEASIEQGVSIPVSVVSAAGAQTQFVDAKLHLGVKPHVTNEGTIAMVISITRNEPDFVNTGARGDPSIQKKEAKTSMLVRDGDTAVIGGIYTRNTGLSNAKVPFFSDIPVLGWFFRNRKENDNRSEFLVFITPRIVNRARALGQ